jgi:hypothetical protein
MGFLDNTTNNIILDAVLTDTGRQFLASNNGSFSIFKFALGDDEIDYGTITKYGRTVGREKIQKNTPIFEALTNQDYAQKYRLLSVSNPDLVYVPTVNLSGAASFNISVNNINFKTATPNLEQKNGVGGQINSEISDVMFIVEMNDLFLQISGAQKQSVDAQQRATYKLARNNVNALGGGTLQFTISAQAITQQLFTVYGVNNVITTYVKVTGMQSGGVAEFPVYISLN